MKRQTITVPGVAPQVLGSHAVRAGEYVFLGGQVPYHPDSGLVPEVTNAPGAALPVIGSKLQSEHILERAAATLGAAGSSLDRGVRIDQFATHPRAPSPYLEARARVMETGTRPASTHIQVEDLLVPGALCGLQLVALTDDSVAEKEVLVVPDMSASPGPPFRPAPHGIVGGDFIFVTGQVAHEFDQGLAAEARTDPETWYGSPIKLQADYTLGRCARVLEHAGASLADVVRADVYLTDMDDRFELEEVWRRRFPEDPPARTYFPTVRLGPRSCIVEVNMIALRPGRGATRESVHAPGVPTPALHHPHAVRAGGFLFVSGLCATEFEGGLAPAARVDPAVPWFASSGQRQTRHILDCLGAICEAGGTTLGNTVWTQNLYTRPEDFQSSREAWNEAFPADPPATLVAGVGGPLLDEGCTVLVDAVAAIP